MWLEHAPNISSACNMGTRLHMLTPATALRMLTPRTAGDNVRIFIEGPLVSLKGSPTVSPATVALCHSEPLEWFFPKKPDSVSFFALSQAPPALDIMMPSM